MSGKKIILLTCLLVSRMNSMDFAGTLIPILQALKRSNEFLVPGAWNTVNDQQAELVYNYVPKGSELSALSLNELTSIGAWKREKVNQFLKTNNSSIQLSPIKDPKGFAVAAIMKITCEWKNFVERTLVGHNSKLYAGVEMKKGYKIFQSHSQNNLIFTTETKNNDVVSIVLPEKMQNNFELLQWLNRLKKSLQSDVTDQFYKTEFPMIDLDQEVSLEWIKNMNKKLFCHNKIAYIDQAFQQTKVKMDQNIVRLESTVALTFGTQPHDIPVQPLNVIKEPLTLVIEHRKNLLIPLFLGQIGVNNWKKPVI